MSSLRRSIGVRIAQGTAILAIWSPVSCASTPPPVADGTGSGPELSPSAVIATVNGDPVLAGELRREMSRGTGPEEKIRTQALERLTEIKVQQALFRAKGIARDTGYAESLRQLEQENQRRSAAHREGRPVYGPVTFQEDQYFRYRFDTDVARLKERLAGREIPVGDNLLRTYYAAVKERFFSKGAELTLDVITSPYRKAGEPVDPAKRRDAEALIRAAEARVHGGGAPADAARAVGLTVRRVRVTTGRTGSSRLETDAVATIGSRLPIGAAARVVDLGDRFVIVRCVARKSQGYASFAQSRDRIKVLYLDQAYRQYVRGLAGRAKVTVDQVKYTQVRRSST